MPGVNSNDKKGFVKGERYSKYKYPRGIHACSLDDKCLLGRVVKSVEESVYSQLSQHFLKHIPTRLRAREIRSRLERSGSVYLGLDVTSWESSITVDISSAVEIPLFTHMCGDLCPDELKYICRQILTKHKIHYRDFSVKVSGGRMSGDLWTSLGNGFINLMIVKYVCASLGYDADGVVEGDDGLFRCDGPIPTEDMFARLGFSSRCEVFHDVGEAGFCKMKFDSCDCQVTDAVERLVKFGWTRYVGASQKCRINLLYTKALSLKSEFPQCPMLTAFADYVIRVVLGVPGRRRLVFDEDRGWTARKIETATAWMEARGVIRSQTRLFYEHLFGVTVDEQLSVESYFDSLTAIVPISHPALKSRIPDVWFDNWDRYVTGELAADW